MSIDELQEELSEAADLVYDEFLDGGWERSPVFFKALDAYNALNELLVELEKVEDEQDDA